MVRIQAPYPKVGIGHRFWTESTQADLSEFQPAKCVLGVSSAHPAACYELLEQGTTELTAYLTIIVSCLRTHQNKSDATSKIDLIISVKFRDVDGYQPSGDEETSIATTRLSL